MASASNALAAAVRGAVGMIENNKEVIALCVGLWTYRTMSTDETRRRSMTVRILAPPFTFGSDDPISAGFISVVAAWSTLSVIQKQAMPLFAVL